MANNTENIDINVNVNSEGAGKSIRAMRMELRELTKQMDAASAEGNTALFATLEQKFGILRNDIKDASLRMKALDPGEILSGFVKLGQGAVGSFAAITGAMSIFGGKSEEIQAIQEKSTAIIQTMMGLEQARQILIDSGGRAEIAGLLKTTATQYKKISANITEALTINTTSKASKAAAAAQWLWNTAIAANPVMILVAAVAALSAGIYLLYKHMKSDEEATKSLNLALEQNQRLIKSANDSMKITLDLQAAYGMSKLKMLETEKKYTNEQAKLIQASIDKLVAKGEERSKDEQAQLDKLYEQRTENVNKIEELENKGRILDIENKKKHTQNLIDLMQDDWSKRRAQIEKTYLEEFNLAGKNEDLKNDAIAKKNRDLRAIQLEEQRVIEKLKLNLLNDGLEKELQAIENNYAAQRKQYKANTEKNKIIRDLLDKNEAKEKLEATIKEDRKIKDLVTSLMLDGATKEKKILQDAFDDTVKLKGEEFKKTEEYNLLKINLEKEFSNIDARIKKELTETNASLFNDSLLKEIVLLKTTEKEKLDILENTKNAQIKINTFKGKNEEDYNKQKQDVISETAKKIKIIEDEAARQSIEYLNKVKVYTTRSLESNRDLQQFYAFEELKLQRKKNEEISLNDEEYKKLNEAAEKEYNQKLLDIQVEYWRQYAENLSTFSSEISRTKDAFLKIDEENLAIAQEKENELLTNNQESALNEFTSYWDTKIEIARRAGLDITQLEKRRAIEEKKLSEQQAKDKSELAIKQAEEQKAIKKKYAGIDLAITTAKIIADTAGAIMKTYAEFGFSPVGIALAIAAGVAGIAEEAVAVNQYNNIMKLRRGGLINGPSHEGGGVQAELEGGEAVINKQSMAVPQFRNIVSRINQIGGGVSLGGSSSNSSSALTATIDPSTIDTIVSRISEIPVIVTEYDITKAQRKVSVIQQRAVIG